jgi:segregation and condensation protein A
MAYEVKLDIFEGPLDLLLHLIKKNEIAITDIPISLITEQYLAYLEVMKSLNLDLAGEYLLLAATLIHIKSKLLLPGEEDQPESDEQDPRAELVRQLLEYQVFKEAAARLDDRPVLERDVFVRNVPGEEPPDEEEDMAEVGVFELIDAFRRLVSGRERQYLEIDGERMSIAETMNEIMERLLGAGHLSFDELCGSPADRRAVVRAFLAVLELVKQRMIKVYQVRPFGAIRIFPAVEA